MSWGFMNATNREQQLFSYGSLSGSQDFYFVTGSKHTGGRQVLFNF